MCWRESALFATQQVQQVRSKDKYFIKGRGNDVRDTVNTVVLDIVPTVSVNELHFDSCLTICHTQLYDCWNCTLRILCIRASRIEIERIIGAECVPHLYVCMYVGGWLGERAAKLIFSMRNNPSDCEESIPRDRMYAALIHPRAPQFAMHKGRRARSRRGRGSRDINATD